MKMVRSKNKALLNTRLATLATIALAFSMKAQAGVATMPWDAGLKSMALDLAGPVAWAIGVIGVVMGASSVVIHHELTGFGQKALITGVGAMMAGFAPGVLTALGIGAAVV
jgi:type IV secretory pathway VirB2 component (pilin)